MRTRQEIVRDMGTMTSNNDKIILEALLDLRELLRDIKVELGKNNCNCEATVKDKPPRKGVRK